MVGVFIIVLYHFLGIHSDCFFYWSTVQRSAITLSLSLHTYVRTSTLDGGLSRIVVCLNLPYLLCT